MKKDKYILFENKLDAQQFINEIDKFIKQHWADPIVQPFNGKAIVPWNNEYLEKAKFLLKGKKVLSPEQAEQSGWYFGYHQGYFAKASTKLEDAMFAREALDMFDNYPNFPAYRATFYGLLVSLFGVKEALRYACDRINDESKQWWTIKFKEIENDQLLKLFIDLHNADKHKLELKHLRPRMELYKFISKDFKPDISSGEGVFSIADRGTKYERRVFFPGAEANFYCYLDVNPLTHKGNDMSILKLKEQIDLVTAYYQDLIWEAKSKFC